ncbi:hypothetical protein D3C77_388880 [compost metagenome]
MTGLGAFTEVGVLQFDKVTHMGAGFQHAAWTQAGKRTGIAAFTHDRAFEVAVGLDHDTLAQGAVLDHAVRADHHVVFNDHTAFENDVDVDEYVATNGHFATHVKTRRVAQGYPLSHQTTRFTQLIVTLQLGQLATVIGALHFHWVQRLLGGDHQAIGNGHGNHVGQVVLTLGVVVRQTPQPLGQACTRYRQNAGVAFLDGFLRVAGILVLNDRCHLALGITDNAPVTRWVNKIDRQQAQLLRGDLGQQALEGIDFDQRHIAVENQHRISRKGRQGLRYRMAGTQLLVLQNKIQIISRQTLTHQLGTVPDHHMNALRLQLTGAVDNMAKHGVAGDRVQYLGQRRAHPGTLACGEDNDIERH